MTIDPLYQLAVSVLIMYLVVGAAALWYRRNQRSVQPSGPRPVGDCERRA